MPIKRVIKYEAAAGSGKTYQLTFEYLKQVIGLFHSHLQSGRNAGDTERLIGSILAITFTNKAATEMKDRILEKLKRFSLDPEKNSYASGDEELLDKLSRELKLDKSRIIQLSGCIIERIISHYHDFNVKTIDSLMSSIIKVISPDLHLPPDFEIGVDGGDTLKGKAVEFIEIICQKEWEFFKKVLSNIKNSEALHQWNMDEEIVQHLVDFYVMAQYRGIGEKVTIKGDLDRLMKARGIFRKSLSALFALISSEGDPDAVHPAINKVLVNSSLISALRGFIQDNGNLKRIDPLLNKKFFTLDDGSSCLKKNADPDFQKKFSRQFRRTRDYLSDFIFLISSNRVSHFSQFFSGFLQFWESQRRIIFVNEFSRTLRKKLTDWEKFALPYIYLKLSDRFRHFLFDEFQDTSELQFQALTPILEEVLISDEKSSLFIVGDRKQAIYRWRGGNAELMDENRLRKELAVLNWLEPKDFTRVLQENFRSGRAIVQFNNSFWDPGNLKLMLDNLGIDSEVIHTVQNNFATAKQGVASYGMENEGYVQVSLLESQKTESGRLPESQSRLHEKCEQIIGQLFDQGYSGCDMAILTRSNEEGRDLVSFLESRQIPTISDESLFLSSCPLIQEIICFLRFIDYPPDHLNLHAFISGKIFKRRADQLFPEEMKKFHEDALVDISEGRPFYKRCKELMPAAWESLVDPFIKQTGFSPPYDIFQDLTRTFQLFENFPDSAPFFLSFGSILHDLEQQEISSIAALLEEWGKNSQSKNPFSITVSDDPTRVRILTIHKAKGLEFPVVIIPLKGKSARGDRNLFWDNRDFYHITKDYARINPELRDLYLNEIKRGFVDELNLLYVAFTRARDALFIPSIYQQTGQSSRPDAFQKFKSFSDILAHHPLIRDNREPISEGGGMDTWREWSWGKCPQKIKGPFPEDAGKNHLSVSSKQISTSEWKKAFLVFATAGMVGIDELKSIERGEAIHRLFSRIEQIPAGNKIKELIKPLAEAENLGEVDCQKLEQFLSRRDVLCFFQGTHEVHIEKEIAGYLNGQMEYRRVDRMVIAGDRIQVIDFKTGSRKTEQYHQQIRDYVRILKPLFPGKAFAGYLLYSDLDTVERVQC